ncbi:hypothetical protein BYT27DRAFT_7339953 [Phlegmacium glaucopus]|nr:hypothetical protein BYT27DRAFT_7339953 [Phlegmacium glaucopus]
MLSKRDEDSKTPQVDLERIELSNHSFPSFHHDPLSIRDFDLPQLFGYPEDNICKKPVKSVYGNTNNALQCATLLGVKSRVYWAYRLAFPRGTSLSKLHRHMKCCPSINLGEAQTERNRHEQFTRPLANSLFRQILVVPRPSEEALIVERTPIAPALAPKKSSKSDDNELSIGKGLSARGLYAEEYKKSHPHVTTGQYRVLWDNIDEATRKEFEQLRKAERKAGKSLVTATQAGDVADPCFFAF